MSDSAHSLGALYKGKKSGALTDISVFSFHAVKNLTTAEGGAVLFNLPSPFNNEEIYQQLCVKTLHGMDKDALAKLQPGKWKYDIVEAGYKMNMPDILAAIGLVELARYEQVLSKRKALFHAYSKVLSAYEWAILPPVETALKESSYHLCALRIKGVNEQQRDELISGIFEKQVSVNVHFIPLPMMSYYKNLGYDIKQFPQSYAQYQNEISLPLYYDLTPGQVNEVCNAVIQTVSQMLSGKTKDPISSSI